LPKKKNIRKKPKERTQGGTPWKRLQRIFAWEMGYLEPTSKGGRAKRKQESPVVLRRRTEASFVGLKKSATPHNRRQRQAI